MVPTASTAILPEVERKTTQISYFDPFDVFKEVKDAFQAKLPLLNLHWHPPGRPLRSIPSLEVNLVEEQASAETQPQHQLLGLSNAPYLKIIFVKCEDTDTYRSLVRKMIREWVSKVVGLRDPTEWLVVHYAPHGGSKTQASVFHKIRADFNSGSKVDRCVQLKNEYTSEMESMEIWSELMTKLKEGVLDAFSRRVHLYEDEIRKDEETRGMMGWNFGTFFIKKEGLALSFENINLFEDAFQLYDDLELTFAKMSQDNSLPAFSSVGFDGEEAPVSLLKLQDNKNMRMGIMSNKISLFDFQCYLFSRQARLLLYMSKNSSVESISAVKIAELFQRLRAFLVEVKRLLTSNKRNPLMTAEWVWNVVKELYSLTESMKSEKLAEGRGEALLLCRESLEIIAAFKGWRIESTLADVSLNDDDDEGVKASMERYQIKNGEVIGHLQNQDSFFTAYRDLTTQAQAYFQTAGRLRSVDRLSTQLALLDFQLGNYEAAATTLEVLPTLYEREGWSNIAISLLNVYVKCLKPLGRKADLLMYSLDLLLKLRTASPESLLNTHTEKDGDMAMGSGFLLSDTDIDDLVENVQVLSSETELKYVMDDWFNFKLDRHIASHQNGLYSLTTEMSGFFRKPLKFDKAILVFGRSDNLVDRISLECDGPELSDKASKLRFITRNFSEGVFRAASMKLIIGKVSFFKDFTKPGIPVTEVGFYQRPSELHASVKLHPEFTLVEKKLSVVVHAPYDVTECRVKITPLDGSATIDYLQSEVVTKSTKKRNYVPQCIALGSVASGSSAECIIPVHLQFDYSALDVKVVVEYTTADGQASLEFKDKVFIGLGVNVQVQDYFKISRLLSRFEINSRDVRHPVRITSVELNSSPGFAVSAPLRSKSSHISLNGNPVHFLFDIAMNDVEDRDKSLSLQVKHRFLRSGKLAMIGEALYDH